MAHEKEILEALNRLTEMVSDNTEKTLESHKISKEGHAHIESVVKSIVDKQLPFDHVPQHDLLRTFLTHSPEAKVHNEDHAYTKSARERMGKLTGSIISALGPIIVAAFLIGAYTWMQNNAAPKPTNEQSVKKEN